MGYTKSEIRARCEKAMENKSAFYKEDFINYRGITADTKELYTEVVAEFLCERIEEYVSGIKSISRESPYKTSGHDGKYDPTSNREEEIIAMQMFVQSRDHGAFPLIGEIVDYQTPLKSTITDDAGKIDLLAFDGNVLRILELKRPDSKETMLRCVLEGFTYMKTVDCGKLMTDFGYDPACITVAASPFVRYGGEQHKEMSQQRPHLQELMTLLNSKPYYYANNIGHYDVITA